ncbi:hypothetical protein [Longirhabdus pacifica]|uniref:hypothetical protein n=1 Tax=Longirhabdus pacifica TaxID=2305227 RepID=UPI001008BF60|nr:hypothetical protein [Longirhabdus pacifica]
MGKIKVTLLIGISTCVFIWIVLSDKNSSHQMEVQYEPALHEVSSETQQENNMNDIETNSTLQPQQGKLLISPSEAFLADNDELKAHLNFMFAESVRLNYVYAENKQILNSLDIWEDGSIVEKEWSTSSSTILGEIDGVYSVSLKNTYHPEELVELVRVMPTDTGYVTTKGLMQIGKSGMKDDSELTIYKSIEQPIQVSVGQYEAVAGYFLYYDNGDGSMEYTSTDSMEEQAAEADWAIVFKVGVFEKE